MIKKVLMSLVAIFLNSNLYSQTQLESPCGLSHKIIYAIAENERHKKRDVGYPYLISFNNQDDFKMVKSDMEELGMIFLDNRTIDCKSKDICAAVTKYLIVNNNIKNLDLGAFQHCYRFYKYKFENYFDLEKSYLKTCNIVTGYVKKYGFNWESIGRYYNKEEPLNKIYREKLQENMIKTYPELALN
jgi:hypothetical protein